MFYLLPLSGQHLVWFGLALLSLTFCTWFAKFYLSAIITLRKADNENHILTGRWKTDLALEMTVQIEEVDNGFIVKIDGYVGNRHIICESVQDVTKEIQDYYKETEKARDEEAHRQEGPVWTS